MALEIPYRGEVGTVSFILKDENNVEIPLSAVTSLTLTFKDKKTKGIINSRNAQNVLNTNEHTLHATSGVLTWNMTANDNPIINADIAPGDIEEHLAEYVWTASGRTGKTKLSIFVRQTDDQILTVTTGQSIDTLYIKKGNNIRYADQFPGSDAGAKIRAAIDDLPSTGGVVDARGLEGTQVISAAITRAINNVIILVGAATFNTNVAPAFKLRDGWRIQGIGEVSTIKGNGLAGALIESADTSLRWYNIHVNNLTLDNTSSTAGTGLRWTNISAGSIENVYINNVQTELLMDQLAYYNLVLNVQGTAVEKGKRIIAGANENTIIGGRSNASIKGIEIDGVSNIMVINVPVEFTGNVIAIDISPTAAAVGIKILGCRGEHGTGGPNGTGIKIGSLSQQIKVVGFYGVNLATKINNLAGDQASIDDQDFHSPQMKIQNLYLGQGINSPNARIYSDTANLVRVRNQVDSAYANIDLKSLIVRENVDITYTTGSPGTLIVGRMTTTQRDGLALTAGMIIYNTTTNTFQGYNGTTWNNL